MVAGFAQLVIDARLHGSADAKATVYTEGEALLVSSR